MFLFCAKGLHSLIKQAENNGAIRGVSLCKDGPKVSHLFFADDSLLFYRVNDHDCGAILEVLNKYEQASGQQINRDKTQIIFSTNMERSIQEFGVSTITQYEKYLGLPLFVGRAKKQSFNYIRERIWHKMQGWKEKLLSQAGREVLIKAVVQAMPTFTMNCFKLYARI